LIRTEIEIPGADRIDSLRCYIRQQLAAKFAPHAHRLRRVSVRLSEYCGTTRGMVLTKCRLEADINPSGKTVVHEALEPNPYRAVDKATDALSGSLGREPSSVEAPFGLARAAVNPGASGEETPSWQSV
jgi:ribosome-associated translation inhibitor RaiA